MANAVASQITPQSAVRMRDALGDMIVDLLRQQRGSEAPSENFGTASIVLWDDQVYDAAARGYEAFREMPRCSAEYDGRMMFWMRRTQPIAVDAVDDFVPCMFARYDNTERVMTLWCPVGKLGVGQYDIQIRTMTAASFAGDQAEVTTEFWHSKVDAPTVARYQFLAQEFVRLEPELLPRPERRRYQRAALPVPDIKTVCLRRSEPAGGSGTGSAVEERSALSCQFLVGAHWRKPLPSMKEQRAVYVRPYVKGPDDAPFKAPRETVYMATR